jgi:flagellar motor switch protein FliG
MDRTRRAAILVASLDEEAADELLRQLPPGEARRVEETLRELDEVDPDEVRDVLEEFRRSSRPTPEGFEGVEFSLSAESLDREQAPGGHGAPSVETYGPGHAEPTSPLSAADRKTLAELLSLEHPQTIAAAVTRLGAEVGGELFAQLPAHLQEDVLQRVLNLQQVDEHAVAEIETHLIRRVSELEELKRRKTAAVDFARRLASHSDLRSQLLTKLPPVGSGDPAQAPAPMTAESADQRALRLLQQYSQAPPERRDSTAAPSAGAKPSEDVAFDRWPRLALLPEYFDDQVDGRRDEAPVDVADDCSEALEALDDQSLMAAIASASEETVLRALAASSDQLVRRVARRLPRKHAAQLRWLLRSLGPTKLADLRSAQRRLLEEAARRVAA